MGHVRAVLGFGSDAGTLYPTSINDTNGNVIALRYLPGLGSVSTNSSARISIIEDARETGGASSGYLTYLFTYSGNQLAAIMNTVGTPENYTFQYGSVSNLASPFDGSTFGKVTTLSSVTTSGIGTAHQFGYNGSGEMTGLTTPLGGALGWSYSSYADTGRSYREVRSRTMSAGFGGMSGGWTITPDSGASIHGTTTVVDTIANSQKQWWFETSAAGTLGLVTQFEERGPMGLAQTQGTIFRKNYTWAADANANVYVGTVVTTADPLGTALQSKSVQTLDVNGNITQQQAFDFGNLSKPARTYNFTYVTDGNYTSRYMLNRLVSATVTPAGGSATALVTNTYDNYTTACPAYYGITARTGLRLHDDANFGTGMTYRGNLTSTTSLGGYGYTCKGYETTGVVRGAVVDGHQMDSAPASSAGYSLPGVLTPDGGSNLATTINYTSSWAVTSVSGPNGATGTTNYDSYGRPSSVSIPDGASTGYAYSYYGVGGATANTQTATIGTGGTARWKKTTLDGSVGRSR